MKFGCLIGIFLKFANLICRSTDIAKCFRGSLRLRDNESRLYLFLIIAFLFTFHARNPTLDSAVPYRHTVEFGPCKGLLTHNFAYNCTAWQYWPISQFLVSAL